MVLVNRQVEEAFGCGREELVGQPVEVLVHDALRRGIGPGPGLGLPATLGCQGDVLGWLGLSTLARAGVLGQGCRQPASLNVTRGRRGGECNVRQEPI